MLPSAPLRSRYLFLCLACLCHLITEAMADTDGRLSLGQYHTAFVTSAGRARAWGSNGYGELGDGSNMHQHRPVDVSGLTTGVIALAAGAANTCAIVAGNGVKCWGDNQYGQVGDGTTMQRPTPANVSGLSSGIARIAAGTAHQCALTVSGGVKCWGYNGQGQLSDGTTTNRLSPTDVVGLTGGAVAIAAGDHTCVVTTGGGVKCWGFNGLGQVGDGTTTNRTTPVDVIGLASGVSAIAAGESFTCALTAGGGVKCWGYNVYGQLGNGNTTNTTGPVDVIGLTSGVTAIAAGEYHACALAAGGGVKCWGYNQQGQLGDGSFGNQRTTPVDVSGLASGVTDIAAGVDHSCAVLATGGVKCWGNNLYGQLGTGTTQASRTPVDVVDLIPTPTPAPTFTPTASPTATSIATSTASATSTATSTPRATNTTTAIQTSVLTPTHTPASTASPTSTLTYTPSGIPSTATPKVSATATPSASPTPAIGQSPTAGPTSSPTATPTSVGTEDVSAPIVAAINGSGKAGRRVTLKYVVADDSDESAETIRVKRGRRVVATIKVQLKAILNGGRRSVKFNSIGQKKGKVTFCVTAADSTGNVGRESCAIVILK